MAVSALLACGDGGSPPMPSTTGNMAFTVAGAGAVVVPATTCELGGTSRFVALAVGFSSISNLCGYVVEHGIEWGVCGEPFGGIVIVKANGTSTPSPVQPGVYAFTGGPTTDQDGNTVLFTSDLRLQDATCDPNNDQRTFVDGGAVVIDSVSGGRVRGSVDLTYADGSTLSGDFDVVLCDYDPEICCMMDLCTK